VLSYGEKIAKIGPVQPEIFDEIRRTTTWTHNAISIRIFYWTDLHQNETVLPSGERAKNACSIILSSLRLYYLVAMANVPWQIGKYGIDPSSAHKAHSYGEKIAKIGPVNPEIFEEIRRTTRWTCNTISIRIFSTKTKCSCYPHNF